MGVALSLGITQTEQDDLFDWNGISVSLLSKSEGLDDH